MVGVRFAHAGEAQMSNITATGVVGLGCMFMLAGVEGVCAQTIPGEFREVKAGAVLKRHHVAADSASGLIDNRGSVATSGPAAETLIYSNTRGRVIIPIPAGFLVADDIATIAPDGCPLTRFTFQVMGNANGTVNEDRPYTVTYALYDTCPAALPENPIPSRLISGTTGTVTIDPASPNGPASIGDVVEVEVPLSSVRGLTSMWLAITFDRENCGVIGGAPPLDGFSGDFVSYPGLGCSPHIGGFPAAQHASFNVEVYGESDSCPCSHLGYRNTREDGLTLIAGAGEVLVDDIALVDGFCLLTGYEVAIEGRGVLDIELRRGCEGDPPSQEWAPNGSSAAIAGTFFKFGPSTSIPGVHILRRRVDPPQLISGTIFLAVKANNPSTGPILTGVQAQVGSTDSGIQQMDAAGGCFPVTLPTGGGHGGLQVTLICDGCADVGACCDMFIKECVGGELAGEPCRFDAECGAGGVCDAICREAPQVNCPFPQRGSLQLPTWVDGGVCDGAEDPFADQFGVADKFCGASACCFRDTDGIDKCRNMTKRDCAVAGDVTYSSQWQLGRLCGQNDQSCPVCDCLGGIGSCCEPHDTPGCNDPSCCSAVCCQPFQGFCCAIEWDAWCVAIARQTCYPLCSPDGCGTGDIDGDGDSDLLDLAGFLRCYRSEMLAVLPGNCSPIGVCPVDLMVGLDDYAAFLGTFTGPE
jgi:hypothetical protein